MYQLGISPISENIVKAACCVSESTKKTIALIASINQVNNTDGYAFTNDTLLKYLGLLKEVYTDSNILLARDHFGPAFCKEHRNLQTILENDLRSGFDAFHIDATDISHKKEFIERTFDSIMYVNPNAIIEVGTESNVGVTDKNPEKLLQEIESLSFVPSFIVTNTGSLLFEDRQAGNVDFNQLAYIKQVFNKYKLKEHNADYLTRSDIINHFKYIDAMNVGPQLGHIQTKITADACIQYGVNFYNWYSKAISSNHWKKWTTQSVCPNINKFLYAGHYFFNDRSYFEIYHKLNVVTDFDFERLLHSRLCSVIRQYIQ